MLEEMGWLSEQGKRRRAMEQASREKLAAYKQAEWEKKRARTERHNQIAKWQENERSAKTPGEQAFCRMMVQKYMQ